MNHKQLAADVRKHADLLHTRAIELSISGVGSLAKQLYSDAAKLGAAERILKSWDVFFKAMAENEKRTKRSRR